MTDNRLALMCGIDIPIKECQIIARQPKIKEIAYLGEQEFFIGVQTLCLKKELLIQDKSLPDNTNNFQIFMTMMSEKETLDKKINVQQVFTLFFPNYNVNMTPRSLIFSDSNSIITVDERNFDFLQNTISEICCLNNSANSQQSFNPSGKKAEEIAKKLMRGRQRVAEQKGETNVSIFTQYLSVLTIGLKSMSLQELMDLTIFQLYDLLERYSLFTGWDIDIRSRLAGAKSDSKPDNWMKNIH